MADPDFASELAQAREEVASLKRRVAFLEKRVEAIPHTLLLSKSQTVRVLAVLGLSILGWLGVGIVYLILNLFRHLR